METYIHDLTVNNWGFPYHIILATILCGTLDKFMPTKYACLTTFTVGLAYEFYQYHMDKPRLGDQLEDIAGNTIGIGICIYLKL